MTGTRRLGMDLPRWARMDKPSQDPEIVAARTKGKVDPRNPKHSEGWINAPTAFP